MFSFPVVQYEQDPFPHCAVRGAWDPRLMGECKQACEVVKWTGEKQDPEKSMHKRWCNQWGRLTPVPRALIEFCHQPKFLKWLEITTGEKCLLPDPYLFGGGIHRVSRGGYLKMHTDFNFHEKLHAYRRLNVLIYLNPGWQEQWGGYLSLGGKTRIAPESNTMVVFTTDDQSWHGHPHPLECPEDVHRDAIALYYYSAIKPTRNYAGMRLNTNYDA